MAAETPARSIRVPDSIWGPLKEAAAEQGETVTDVTMDAYVKYLRKHKPEAVKGLQFSVRRGQ